MRCNSLKQSGSTTAFPAFNQRSCNIQSHSNNEWICVRFLTGTLKLWTASSYDTHTHNHNLTTTRSVKNPQTSAVRPEARFQQPTNDVMTATIRNIHSKDLKQTQQSRELRGVRSGRQLKEQEFPFLPSTPFSPLPSFPFLPSSSSPHCPPATSHF